MPLQLVHDDLANRAVDALVNAWNRNFIPHWLLIPQGVARSLRRRAGSAPFQELARHGLLPLGGVVATCAGALPARWIIHAAALHAWWRASPRSVALATRHALILARELGATSVAMPLLGAGTGGLAPRQSFDLIDEAWRGLDEHTLRLEVVVRDEAVYRELDRRST
jgi:O-acetyl-ADP-ribose deacetylase (regulator of RNase III)